ncbi:MAG: pilus assembly protein PilM [Planctomycetes bacterium]|nr:pilus assembly protein PilM [Planctomycetota bacterium]
MRKSDATNKPVANRFHSRALTPIGLDFGATAVRAVQLRRVGPRYSVVAAVELGLRSERNGEQRKGSPQGLARRIQRALARQDFRGRQVVMGLSPPDVELHPLAIPIPPQAGAGIITDPTLAQAARIEVQRLAGFETEQVETDWWALPPGRGTDTTAMGVAARTDQVIELCEMCRVMGYECQSIDVSPCATARFGFALHPPADDQVWAVLDVGARSTRLAICIDDVPVLARAVGGGGQEWTQRIAETLEVTPESAEVFKCDHGMQLPGRVRPHSSTSPTPPALEAQGVQSPAAATRGGSGLGELRDQTPSADSAETGTATQVLTEVACMIYSVLKPNLDILTREIERSYAYVLQSYPNRCAGPLLLLGAGAAMKNLDRFLSDRLGIRITDAETFRSEDRINFSIAGTERLGSLACAIGLAIGS